jgi:CxxC-x17-CxxC domain-containing protein
MQFVDRFLKCSDCGNEFVFTAGEQLFFHDKQFKNDPKRCKLCKARRAGLGRSANPSGAAALPLSRTETRTLCSACGIETTVPFKPTQGRPVLCRECFQLKRVPATATVASLEAQFEAQIESQIEAQIEAQLQAGENSLVPDTELLPVQPHAPQPMSQTTMEMISEGPSAILHEHEPLGEGTQA